MSAKTSWRCLALAQELCRHLLFSFRQLKEQLIGEIDEKLGTGKSRRPDNLGSFFVKGHNCPEPRKFIMLATKSTVR